MKILLVTQNFYPEIGSCANRFQSLYMQLSKNHDVSVLTTHPTYPNAKIYHDEKYWNQPELNNSTDVFRLKMRSSKQSRRMSSRILYYMELSYKVRIFIKRYQHEYDVVYVTTPNIFLPWAAFFFQKKHPTTKRVLEVRDLWPDSVREIESLNIDMFFGPLKLMEQMMYRKADKIVINNEGFRPHIAKMAPLKSQLFIPNGFMEDEVSFREASEDFRVIYTGNIGFAQSYEQLVEVAHLLEERKITFNIIGYGVNAHRFNKYIRERPFEYVHTHSAKSREECLRMIRSHNIQLSLLKESEVFMNVLPGKVVDGIGCGTPVVTNLGGYTNRLINNNEVGYAKEKATAEEIVDAIEMIKGDRELEERYRENAKALLHEVFLWEKNINKLERMLEKNDEIDS